MCIRGVSCNCFESWKSKSNVYAFSSAFEHCTRCSRYIEASWFFIYTSVLTVFVTCVWAGVDLSCLHLLCSTGARRKNPRGNENATDPTLPALSLSKGQAHAVLDPLLNFVLPESLDLFAKWSLRVLLKFFFFHKHINKADIILLAFLRDDN